MPSTYPLTRQLLDSILVKEKEPKVRLGCTMHPEAGVDAVYQDGKLRLLCRECGFEAAAVKVAGEAV